MPAPDITSAERLGEISSAENLGDPDFIHEAVRHFHQQRKLDWMEAQNLDSFIREWSSPTLREWDYSSHRTFAYDGGSGAATSQQEDVEMPCPP